MEYDELTEKIIKLLIKIEDKDFKKIVYRILYTYVNKRGL